MTTNIEIWIDMKRFEGKYTISTFGQIKSIITNKIMVSSKGRVRLFNRKRYYIDQLVAENFIPNPNNLPKIEHIDGDISNNKIDNLRWGGQIDTKRIDTKDDIWKDIKKFQNLYQISSLGKVKNIKTNILKIQLRKKSRKTKKEIGHLYVYLSNQHYNVHKLVADHFIPNPNNLPIIEHIDGNILNNKLDNLRWGGKITIINGEKEIWKDIEKYENTYQISSYGRFKSKKYDKLLVPIKKMNHYIIGLHDSNGKRNFYRIHRLVARHFMENPNKCTTVEHIDKDISNNHISNLRWISSNDNEIWIDIKNYESLYQISTLGRIFSKRQIRIIKPSKRSSSEKSYLTISLTDENSNETNYYIHRLVAKNFIPNPENLSYVDHIDRQRHNNDVRNLRWVTRSQNGKNIPPRKIYLKEEVIKHSDEVFMTIGLFKKYDFPDYKISNYGNVISFRVSKNGRYIKKIEDAHGYPCVNMVDSKSKESKTIKVHQLVAFRFIPNLANVDEVNHKDRQKNNNHWTNLEWVNRQQNMIHAMGKKIAKIDMKTNQIIEEYVTITEAAAKSNLHASSISLCCKGKISQSGGFKWKFI